MNTFKLEIGLGSDHLMFEGVVPFEQLLQVARVFLTARDEVHQALVDGFAARIARSNDHLTDVVESFVLPDRSPVR